MFVSTWHGQTKIELRPYSATIPDVFMPCGPGVNFPIERLPELLASLHDIKARKARP